MNRALSRGCRGFEMLGAAETPSRRLFLTSAYRCTTGLDPIALLPRTQAEGAAAAGAQARTTALASDAGWRDPDNKTHRLTMPAFAEDLSSSEIRDVVACLKTFWTPEQQKFQLEESEHAPFPPAAMQAP